MDREPGVYDVEIPYGIKPGDVNEDLWDLEEIQAKHVDCEINPFTGRPFFNEVVFFHKPSKSLLVTDIYWNYPGSIETNEILDDKTPEQWLDWCKTVKGRFHAECL